MAKNQPQQPLKPMAELVLRFRTRLAHDAIPTEGERALALPPDVDPSDAAVCHELYRRTNPTVKVFRTCHFRVEGSIAVVSEVGGPSHFFHFGDIESVEATPSQIETVS